ncbi:NepR family anti-sigma factor [Prosthecomicrobium sp. N25]|uniref:NepR family anti-sigma factor n=1 Tax=Prosthecomicrobium sp. N25 TaxID=3129254 RepID=UPI0030772314
MFQERQTVGLIMTDKKDPRPSLPEIARDAIGRRLRESLDRIVAEPIPDRFLRLLDDLEQSQTPSGAVEGEPSAARERRESEDAEGAGA